MLDLYDSLMDELVDGSESVLSSMSYNVYNILIAAFGIAVGFVAYKLIKRALNKA